MCDLDYTIEIAAVHKCSVTRTNAMVRLCSALPEHGLLCTGPLDFQCHEAHVEW